MAVFVIFYAILINYFNTPNMKLILLTIVFTFATALCNVITGPPETVQGETYVFYNLTAIDSSIYLQLISLKGDCDLYVSETTEFPSYKDYTLHSATCGVDSIILLKRSKGPVHIGIYGHPAHETSECALNVCLLDHPEETDDFWDELSESTKLTDSVIEQKCKKKHESRSALSYLRSGLDIIAHIAANITIEFDGWQVASAFMQALI